MKKLIDFLFGEFNFFDTIIIRGCQDKRKILAIDKYLTLKESEYNNGRNHKTWIKIAVTSESELSNVGSLIRYCKFNKCTRINGIINDYVPVYNFGYYSKSDLNLIDKNYNSALVMGKIINLCQSELITAIQGSQVSENDFSKQAIIASKNGFRGFIISDLSEIENVSRGMIPSKKLLNEAIEIVEALHAAEGKYLLSYKPPDKFITKIKKGETWSDFRINRTQVANNLWKKSNMEIDGAAQIMSREFFDEYKEKPEAILVDKATDMMMRNVLKRAREINQKRVDCHKKPFLSIEQLGVISKFSDEHIHSNGLPIDFTEYEMVPDTKKKTAFSEIRSRINGEIFDGHYDTKIESYVYDIEPNSNDNYVFVDKTSKKNISRVKLISRLKNWEKDLENDIIKGFETGVQNIFPCLKEKFAEDSLKADAQTIFDLEDSVAPTRKDEARKYLIKQFESKSFTDILDSRKRSLWVRINNVRSRESARDFLEVIAHPEIARRIHGLFLPKVETEMDIKIAQGILKEIQRRLAKNGTGIIPGRLRIQAMIESARSVENCDNIAREPSVVSLISGLLDYKCSLNAWDMHHQFPDSLYEKTMVVRSAEKHNRVPVDSITASLTYEKALEESIKALMMGFCAKWSVYPSHIIAAHHASDMSLPLLEALNIFKDKYYNFCSSATDFPTNKKNLETALQFLKSFVNNCELFASDTKMGNLKIDLSKAISLIEAATINDDKHGSKMVIKLIEESIPQAQKISPGWPDIELKIGDYEKDNKVEPYNWKELIRKARSAEPLIIERKIDRPNRTMESGVNGVIYRIDLSKVRPNEIEKLNIDSLYLSPKNDVDLKILKKIKKSLKKNNSLATSKSSFHKGGEIGIEIDANKLFFE